MKWWQNERQLRLKMRERQRRRREARRIRNIRLARNSLGIVDKPKYEHTRIAHGVVIPEMEMIWWSEASDETKW